MQGMKQSFILEMKIEINLNSIYPSKHIKVSCLKTKTILQKFIIRGYTKSKLANEIKIIKYIQFYIFLIDD